MKKEPLFPLLTIFLLISLAILAAVDYASNHIFAVYTDDELKNDINIRILKHLLIIIIYGILVIPYLIRFQRVKATFKQKK
ncbi:DUF2569 family protein [Paenibacillus sp. P26]|nr:DUF2569 family protein [Paenibacillus sp. P26]